MYLTKNPFARSLLVPFVKPVKAPYTLASIITRRFSFANKTTSETSLDENKLTEKYELSQDEITSILRRPKKPINILHQHEVEDPELKQDYEEQIEAKLGKVRLNVIKKYSEQMDEAMDLKENVPTVKPSDRPDVKYYKYDLPIPNIDPEIKGVDELLFDERAKQTTPNLHLWEVLQIDGKTAYKSFELELNKKYNNGNAFVYIRTAFLFLANESTFFAILFSVIIFYIFV